MNFLTLRRLATQVLVVTVALAAVLTSGAPAQSLGDVARKEEARRKETASGKTYTNENLRSAPEPAAPAPSSTASAPSSSAPSAAAPAGTKPSATPDAKGGDAAKAGDAPKADAKPAADPKADAAAWKKRREAIDTALERAKTFAEALQSRINGLTADFAARDDPAQRARVATERQKALTEMERVKKEIADHTKALSDLQEEARKSGVPPGWLR